MKLETRTDKLKIIRENDLVPGVIYGKKITATPIQADHKEFLKHYHEFGTSMTFKVKLDGKTHQVYIKELQIDPLNRQNIVHFDMIKVTASDTMTADISLILEGRDPVEARGLIVQLVAQTVHAEYSVGSGVTSFRIDVSGLNQGDTLHIKDIELPEGIKLLDDPEKMIVNVTLPAMEEEPEEDEEEEDVEVEAIKQKGDDTASEEE